MNLWENRSSPETDNWTGTRTTGQPPSQGRQKMRVKGGNIQWKNILTPIHPIFDFEDDIRDIDVNGSYSIPFFSLSIGSVSIGLILSLIHI